MRLALATAALSAVLALSACAAESDGGPSTSPPPSTPPPGNSSLASTPSAPSCASDTLDTHEAGKLTIATDSPAFGPWFVDNDPTNGKGFESAVAYAVAKQLGYTADQVKWIVAKFDSVIAPTPKKFDFDINQFSITAERAKVLDFSSPYYDVAQVVVALKDSKIAKAASLADLKGAKLAAQKGTTSFDAINEVIKPGPTPAEFPTNDLAVQALKNGQVDGLVVDLPTGFFVTAVQVENGTIVGQVPPNGEPEQFGLVLEKDSPITDCLSQAVDTLRADGTLDQLQQKWLASVGGAPVLK